MCRTLFLLFIVLSALCCKAQPVKLLCNWNDTAGVPLNGIGQRYNDCWGFVQDGREYGVIGGTDGAHIIDIDACRQVAFAPGSSTGVIHRDYKTYSHYLYAVADEGADATLQIYDYSYLPDSLHLVYQSDKTVFNRCHNIFIDTAKGKLYCATFSLQGTLHDRLRVYSLAEPVNPVLLARYNNLAGDVHDVYVRNDTAYCSASYAGYFVVDFTNTSSASPVIGGLPHYEYQGYNHSSWVGPNSIGVMADETFGKPLKVIDTRNLMDMRVTATFGPRDTAITSIPHNPYIRGAYVYISYYMDGFQLWDISNPSAPRQAGAYATFKGTPYQGYAGAWGCYPFLPSRRVLVSDMQNGLFVLDADEAIGIHKEAQLSAYPNPAATTLFLQLPYDAKGNLRYDVLDVRGRVIISAQQAIAGETNPPLAIPLPPAMPAGVYVLRAAIGGQALATRFIKL